MKVEKKEDANLLPALQRLHNRLHKDLGLYKLHIKHYHMSLKQFGRRTPELALPEAIYEKYDKICKTCDYYTKQPHKMVRARVSGIRADNFGDLLFVDHAEVSFRGHVFLVLPILDAATSLLAAYPQSNAQTEKR